ncbi:helix-turn-helix transcriptional regulator [Wukongibacter sp. M2B1]|uniref:helix-turn-helix transcriptional regulator n=1 Tax=Wukongibacter sp. M2B1 TaxID=3088895 RepID=UPI003D791AC2
MRDILINLRGKKSQSEVAEKLGITQQFLSAIEREEKNPSITIMRKFEEHYNKSMVELFPDIFLRENTTNSCKIATIN